MSNSSSTFSPFLDQGLDLVVLRLGQLDVRQDGELVPGGGVAVQHPERLGLGELDGAQGAGVDHDSGEGRDEGGIGIFARAAAAVAGEARALARDQNPGALVGGLVGRDLGDGRLDGGFFLLDVLGRGAAARDGIGIRFQDDDRPALDALGPGGEAGRAEPEGFFGGLDHAAEPRPAVEPDRELPGFVEIGFEAPLLELPDGPFGRVGVGVRARLAAAEAVAEA